MTYGQGSEVPQHLPHPRQQPPGWGPPPSGPQWTGPPPPPPPPPGPQRKRPPTPLILIVVGALVLAGVITVILLSARGGDSRLTPATSPLSAPSTPVESTKDSPGGGGSEGGARPLPPPTPTGTAYQDEPDVGACVDIARGANGTVLYQADCTGPAASLILDNKQPQGQKCQGLGFFGLRGFSGQIMCFTYKVAVGDCVDMDIPRRAACTPTPANGPKGKVTITEIHRGARDGTPCGAPLFLEVGNGDDRGVACFTPISTGSAGSATPTPSR